jgi:hypothetical protein
MLFVVGFLELTDPSDVRGGQNGAIVAGCNDAAIGKHFVDGFDVFAFVEGFVSCDDGVVTIDELAAAALEVVVAGVDQNV